MYEIDNRKMTTTIKVLVGDWLFNLQKCKMIDREIEVYELSPEEAQRFNNAGYVLNWIHKIGHHKGEPSKRLYQILGRHKKKVWT